MRISLAFSLLLLAQSASAQTFTATVSALRGNGEERTETQDIVKGFNLLDCEDTSAELEIQFNRTPTQFDLWHNDGGSIDCTTTDNRLSNAADRNCVHITTSATTDIADTSLVIPLADILAGDVDNGKGSDLCSRDRTSYTFLIISSSAAIETGEISEFGTFTVNIDGVAPIPPTFENTDRTGNQITLNWDPVSDVDMVNQLRYVVEINNEGCTFLDTDAGTASDAGVGDAGTGTDAGGTDAGADAGMMIADAGADAGDGGMTMMARVDREETGLGETSISINLSDYDVMEAGTAGVRVATIDQAGNEGIFSNVVCITRQTGVGPCDVIEGGCDDSCSVSATTPGGSGAPIAILALALGLAVRRGRR